MGELRDLRAKCKLPVGLSVSLLCVDSNSLTPLGPTSEQNQTVLFYSNNFTQFCKWLTRERDQQDRLDGPAARQIARRPERGAGLVAAGEECGLGDLRRRAANVPGRGLRGRPAGVQHPAPPVPTDRQSGLLPPQALSQGTADS